VATFCGQFEQVEAKLEDGVVKGAAHVESVTTAIPDLKAHLLSPDFFNAEQTPTITFTSRDIRIGDEGSVEVDGELTIRGVTEPVTATGTIAVGENFRGDEVVGLDLEARIDRREYGLDWQTKLPSGGDVLAWEVVLQVHLQLAKA
jgi:polyisoprenoid-binding protein YceI